MLYKRAYKPSSVVCEHLSTNSVSAIPQRYFNKLFRRNSLMKEFVNLASGGVYIAPRVAAGAVGSYPAFSTLPQKGR